MFKTLIGKFSFFFWLIFLLLNLLVYFFTNFYIQNILKQSESDKIALMLNTLKPAMAYDISFHQEKQLTQLLENLLHAQGIESIKLTYADKHQIFKSKEATNKLAKLFAYTSNIKDPFTNKTVAKITLNYSNAYINTLHTKILTMQLSIFIITLFFFLIFFLYVKRDLNALRKISNALQKYSQSKTIEPLTFEKTSQEIETITSAANAMIIDISQYLQELKDFNAKLKEEIAQEIQKVQKQESMLLHQSRQAAMGEILESIAHQWRQPLNIIGISVSNLEMQAMVGSVDIKELEEKLALIAANTNYMSDTIDDFRNFLNPQREQEYFNPKESIESVLAILKDELKSHHIHCHIAQKDTVSFFGVENEFKQLLLILINNAKDAITSQIEHKQISFGEIIIVISQKNAQGVISVEDNGGGIQEDIMESIFEPYFSTKFASHGTGIGLYMGKNIVNKRFNGSLRVHNTHKGCCFTIEIPIQKEEIQER